MMYREVRESLWNSHRLRRAINVEKVFGHLVETYHLSKGDISSMMRNSDHTDKVKQAIRDVGNKHNKTILMELILEKTSV
jgi:hypothetical protein